MPAFIPSSMCPAFPCIIQLHLKLLGEPVARKVLLRSNCTVRLLANQFGLPFSVSSLSCRIDAALEAYNTAVVHAGPLPLDLTVYLNLGSIYLSRGCFTEAKDVYSRGLPSPPGGNHLARGGRGAPSVRRNPQTPEDPTIGRTNYAYNRRSTRYSSLILSVPMCILLPKRNIYSPLRRRLTEGRPNSPPPRLIAYLNQNFTPPLQAGRSAARGAGARGSQLPKPSPPCRLGAPRAGVPARPRPRGGSRVRAA